MTRIAALAAIGGLLAAGFALAQPATNDAAPAAQPGPLNIPPAAQESPPGAPVAEEAPPAMVETPAPVAAPPIQATEVAPAAPPKAQAAEKPTETTIKRARYDVAVLQALDKVTAESVRFKAEVGKPVRYKNLVFTVRACERAGADEMMDDSIAYLAIHSQPKPIPGKPSPPARRAFQGWMYASSPGLSPLEHPVYDAWLITCTTASPVAATSSAPKSPAAPSARASLR
jgi:hypothetical protein